MRLCFPEDEKHSPAYYGNYIDWAAERAEVAAIMQRFIENTVK